MHKTIITVGYMGYYYILIRTLKKNKKGDKVKKKKKIKEKIELGDRKSPNQTEPGITNLFFISLFFSLKAKQK